MVSDSVNFGDDFSEDETPIESIEDEKEKRACQIFSAGNYSKYGQL
jgi:hypothetical protein